MSFYMVRIESEPQRGEIVGLYCAASVRALWHLVDEIVSPTVCSYAKLPDGGVCWSGPAPAIDDIIDHDDGDIAAEHHPRLTSVILAALPSARWKPLPSFAEILGHKEAVA